MANLLIFKMLMVLSPKVSWDVENKKLSPFVNKTLSVSFYSTFSKGTFTSTRHTTKRPDMHFVKQYIYSEDQ